MKKKGFTLIELLATIIVLAVIALISIPLVLGVIGKAKKGATRDSVLSLFEAAKIYYASNMIDSSESGEIVFECNGTSCKTTSGDILPFKGDVPTSGQVILRNNLDAEAYYIKINGFCALGNKDTLDIQEDCTSLDSTKAEITLSNVTSTTTTSTIRVQTSDVESGIASIKYEVNGESIVDVYDDKSSLDTTKKFEGLSQGQTYTVVVTVTNGNGMTETKTIDVTTTELGTLLIKFNTEPSTSVTGYYRSVEAYLDYDGSNAIGYFVKSERAGTSNVAITKSCGTGTIPSECTDITSTNTLEANVWYYTDASPRITYNETSDTTGTLYARATDGESETTNSSGIITKIDSTLPVLTLSTATVTSKSITIPITVNDANSGINSVTCKYGVTEGNYTNTNGVTATQTSCTIENIASGTTYYYQVCATDMAGNESCDTGNTSTTALTGTLVIDSSEPASAVNGYYKSQTWKINTVGNVTGYYVKSTRAATSSVALTATCGSDTNPGECTDTSTTSMAANTWYYTTSSPKITYSETADTTGTLYARVTDGYNTTLNTSATVSKIDRANPTVTLSTATVTSKSITIPITVNDANSGINSVTCKYGVTEGNYTNTNGVTATTSNCTIENIASGTTYYYQVCATDMAGNETCTTGNTSTTALTGILVIDSKNPENAINGYYKSQTWKINTVGNVTGYYVKSTRTATSSVALTATCGTETIPGECTDTSTTSMAANTWYYTANNPKITYEQIADTTATLYARVTDGYNNSSNSSTTVSMIDNVSPTLILGDATVTSKSITIPVTSSDANSGLKSATCKYGTTNGSYTNDTGVTATTSNCTISNITSGTTYYYQVCVTDGVGNESCDTGNTSTTALTAAVVIDSKDPASAVNGYYKSQTWKINTTGSVEGYYIKSTINATSNVNLIATCGSDTNPGECTNTNTTSMLANVWYYTTTSPKVIYSETNNTTAILYAKVTDGYNNSANADATISKIDSSNPSVTLGTVTVTSKSITIPVTSSDDNSGLGSATCKYGTTSGSYTNDTSVTATTSNCTISNIAAGTTYYYQVCVTDGVGNEACSTGTTTTTELKATLVVDSQEPSSSVNGYYKSQTWKINTTGSVEGYYIKSTRAATSDITLTKTCGSSTNPGECTNTSTTIIEANMWYYTTSSPKVTYSETADTTAILYARATDGYNNSTNVEATISKIDAEVPSVTIGAVTSTANSITIPYTLLTGGSGGSIECQYGTGSSYINGSSSNITIDTINQQCIIKNLSVGTTYNYQITPKNGFNDIGTIVTNQQSTQSSNIYLLENSNQYTSITGGWIFGYAWSYLGSGGVRQITSSGIIIGDNSTSTYDGGMAATNNAINFSNYNTMKVTFTVVNNYTCGFAMGTSAVKMQPGTYYNNFSSNISFFSFDSSAGTRTVTIDISQVTENRYPIIWFGCGSYSNHIGNVTVSKIELLS